MKVEIGRATVNAQVADNILKQTLGLMFRRHLGKNSGMLFIFSREDRYSFWMFNTYMPLDMIWIGKNKQVVDVTKNARPWTLFYTPKTPSMYVLEVNAGFAGRHKITVGMKVKF